MVHKFCFAGLLVVFSSAVCSGQTLTRTWTHSTSHAYAWIDLAGEDYDDDSGAGNTNVNARVEDYNDTTNLLGYGYAEADAEVTISPPNQAAHAVEVSGYTSVDSYLSGGFYNGSGAWSPGFTSHFNAQGHANVQVSGNGAVGHYVSVMLDVGSTVATGSVYGWATVGDYQLSYSWSGGDLDVEVFKNGARINWYSVGGNSSGQYVVSETFGQTVTHGEHLQIQAHAIVIDDSNPEQIDKLVTVLAGST